MAEDNDEGRWRAVKRFSNRMAEAAAEGEWRPLSVRGERGEDPSEYEALHEGVPSWLKESLTAWVRDQLCATGDWSTERLRRLERELRLSLAWERSPGATLLADLNSDGDLFLDVVDYLLRDVRWFTVDPNHAMAVTSLRRMLSEAGSAWEVVTRAGGHALERRVLEGVATSVRATFKARAAGPHMRRAWAAAYGRHPDPTTAYSEAVKAVEAAAQPIVTPKDAKATLGKMVSALRDAPQKWDVALAARPGFDRVQVVGAMADLLCQGQTDRHGTPNPTPVNQEQVEAAVHLAATLVHWFTAGSIRVRS